MWWDCGRLQKWGNNLIHTRIQLKFLSSRNSYVFGLPKLCSGFSIKCYGMVNLESIDHQHKLVNDADFLILLFILLLLLLLLLSYLKSCLNSFFVTSYWRVTRLLQSWDSSNTLEWLPFPGYHLFKRRIISIVWFHQHCKGVVGSKHFSRWLTSRLYGSWWVQNFHLIFTSLIFMQKL